MPSDSSSSSDFPSFYLVSANKNADKVLSHPDNEHLLCQTEDGRWALLLSFLQEPRPRITMGKHGCNVMVPDSHSANIHRTQCIFAYSYDTGAVVLHDRSSNNSTKVYDPDVELTVPFSRAERSVVVAKGFNGKVAIGSGRYYQFQLKWKTEAIRIFSPHYPYQFGPSPPGNRDTDKFRYIIGEELGTGGFGTVFKAANIHNGKIMAVKRFHSLGSKRHKYAISEVNNQLMLSNNNQTSHDNILPILDVVYDETDHRWIEIFMPLKKGSVRDLVYSEEKFYTDDQIANSVLAQMLQALSYMASKKLVHRDIKPDNILYDIRTLDDGTLDYHFMLADFGLSKSEALARSMAGTGSFMAPEVSNQGHQSPKTDVWSLFATIVWVRDIDKFREVVEPIAMIHNRLMEISKLALFKHICKMAEFDPEKRISARRLLAHLETLPESEAMEDIESEFGDMHLDPGDDSQPRGGTASFIPSIPADVADKFEKRHGYNPHRRSKGTMMGDSALADFGSSPNYIVAEHQTGRFGYEYAPYSRTESKPRHVGKMQKTEYRIAEDEEDKYAQDNDGGDDGGDFGGGGYADQNDDDDEDGGKGKGKGRQGRGTYYPRYY